MITVETTDNEVRVSIPTSELSREDVQNFIDLVRMEAIVRRSTMTASQVRDLAEEIDAGWWTKNAHRFVHEES